MDGLESAAPLGGGGGGGEDAGGEVMQRGGRRRVESMAGWMETPIPWLCPQGRRGKAGGNVSVLPAALLHQFMV
ncbi:hypothetical protein DAI22_10g100000 [Oryza sativa Japonica Group]|nr:hypothetical protein DAI22_10g100000 [Oryza sativa Japonica Group]